MLNKEVKLKILQENNLEKVLEILVPYKGQDWGEEIMKHIQKITPNDKNTIDDYSYLRKD